MPQPQQTRRRGVTEIGDDSTSTPTHRRSSQIRQATGDPTHQSRRLDSTRRVHDFVTAASIVTVFVILITLPGFGFWQLLWVTLLGFWRLLWAVFLGFWRLLWAVFLGFWRLLWGVLLWGVGLLCSWLLDWVALPCSWLMNWVVLPAVSILGLIAWGMGVADFVRERAEVAPPYPSNDTAGGDNAPTTTGRGGEEGTDSAILTEELANLGGPKEYSYKELSKATNSFASNQELGVGGFGIVYKGHIGEDRTPVAVKKIRSGARQGITEYNSEVTSLSQLRHKNLVRLLGYCHKENNFILVYEFIGGGSLDKLLFGDGSLTWERRYNIAMGLASALYYLHKQCHQCVIHRDIKSSNVILDENFEAKLGDFGLAKLVEHTGDLSTTQVKGTPGYMAPEYFRTGKASEESDIYSFGVVLLEIVCGRRATDLEGGLVRWAWERCGCGSRQGGCFQNFKLVDEKLGNDFDKKQAEALMILGLLCAHPIASSRPPIEKVMAVLNSTAEPPKLPSKMPSFNV